MIMERSEMKVALYIRLAQEDVPLIGAQEKMLRQFAEQQGFTDAVCFIDNGYSGLNLNRPAFSEMEKAIRAGEIHTVLVRDISRIGRNIHDVPAWMDWLNERGVKLITLNGGYYMPADLSGVRAAIDEFLSGRRGQKKAK
jgi:DNA invertase Pin-like site-specific DNA recombinase